MIEFDVDEKMKNTLEGLVWQIPLPRPAYEAIGWSYLANYNNQEAWYTKGERILKTKVTDNKILFPMQICYKAYYEGNMTKV